MTEVPIEELLKRTGSVFKLVNLAARRTSQLNEGSTPRVEYSKQQKLVNIALQEIGLGKIQFRKQAVK